MSYSKDIDKYPAEFGELVRKGSLAQITMEMTSPRDAQRLMGRLYAFLGALGRAAEDLANVDDHLMQETYRAGKKVQFRVDGSNLILRPLDQDSDAKRIRALFGREPAAGDSVSRGKILVPVDAAAVPEWLAKLAQKAQE